MSLKCPWQRFGPTKYVQYCTDTRERHALIQFTHSPPLSIQVERLVVDTPEVHAQVMSYLAENNSEHLMNRVELYSGKQGVMDAFGVEGQINSIFQSRVQLDSGAYLVIQKTEALWSIDVNGGRAVTSGKRARAEAQSETHLRINLEAARQVAKELRARDLSGIVVVDFIDMASPGGLGPGLPFF